MFSLSKLRKITEEGVTFASHLDGHRIFMGPEESMRIQAHLGSTIAMAFDECMENPAEYRYAKNSCDRTVRWLAPVSYTHLGILNIVTCREGNKYPCGTLAKRASGW